MWARKQADDQLTADKDAAEEAVQEETPSDSGPEKGRVVPAHIRKLAKEAAGRHDMALADFLAEAIVAYGEHLDETEAPRIELPPDPIPAIRGHDARLDALERRLSMLEAEVKRERAMDQVWLEKYVHRPWLRRRGT